MMEIVIKIHEKDYQSIKNGHIPFSVLDAIMKGAPLPEHHGRLIDENDLKTLYGLDDRLWWGNAVNEFKDLPTIIEADKGE